MKFDIVSRLELVQRYKLDIDGEFYVNFLSQTLEVQKKHTLQQTVEQLKKWRDAGTHLVSREAIDELQKEAEKEA